VSDEVKIDFSQIKKAGKYIKKVFTPQVLTILLVLIPIILTIVFRMQPADLPVTEDWARSNVYNFYRNNIVQQVAQQYPNLPSRERDVFINTQFNQFLEQNGASLEQQVAQTQVQMKPGFQLEQGGKSFTYLGDLDSYYYLRQARNIVETGTACDGYVDDKCFDTYVLAPEGMQEKRFSLHAYFIALTYRVANIFTDGIPLMYASFLVPTIVAVLSALALFFLVRRIVGDAGAFIGALLLSVSPLFLTRTLGSDTDVWNAFFPIVILLFYMMAWDEKRPTWQLIYGIITGVAIGLFAWAWEGFWFILIFLIAMTVGVLAFYALQRWLLHKKAKAMLSIFKEKRFKRLLVVFGVTLASSLIFIPLLGGFGALISVVRSPFDFIALKAAVNPTLWPNVYTTVAELGGASINSVIQQAGGKLMFFIALFGIISTMLPKKMDWKEWTFLGISLLVFMYLITDKALQLSQITYLIILAIPLVIGLLLLLKHPEADVKYAILLTIWVVATIYASAQGVRFILLILPAIAVAIGVGLGYLFNRGSELLATWKLRPMVVQPLLLLIIFFLLLLTPVKAGYNATHSFVPSMNDGWWSSLDYINQNSEPDAIINSWWDFGHWFKYVADRRVTLDGATQNHPNAHWLGKLMLTDNEQESIAILRMLDCGSNGAFERINDYYDDAITSKMLLDELIMMNKEDGRQFLLDNGFSSSEASAVLENTHCNPPENFFITSEDMVGKAGVWAHFGAWDFTRSYIAYNVRGTTPAVGIQKLQNKFNYTQEEASQLYNSVHVPQNDRAVNDWVAPWPSYINGRFASCTNVSSDNITCNLGLVINQNAQHNVVLEKVETSLSNPQQETKLVFATVDRATGLKVGQTVGLPTGIAIATDDGITRYDFENQSFETDILLVRNENQFLVLLMNEHLTESIFTKLFFLEGAYTEHFTKVYDVVQPIGQRIIVWKVDWPNE